MTTENYSDLLNQAEQAFANQDPRKGMAFVLQILNKDFTNDPAWQLLYRIMKAKQPFEVFQMELAIKYFPDKVHLLMEKELANLLPSVSLTPQKNPPLVQIQPIPNPPASLQPPSTNICPHCGKPIFREAVFCGYCGGQVSLPSQKIAPKINPPIIVRSHNYLLHPQWKHRNPNIKPPVIVQHPVTNRIQNSQQTQVTYQIPPSSNRFTPKRVVSAIGMFLIIIAGMVTWSSARNWQGIFNGGYNSYGTIGLETANGIISTGAAVLGIILLFTSRNETIAHLLCVGCSVIAALAALTYKLGTSWGYSGGYQGFFVDYASLGMGVYMVFIGAVIVIGCFLIPSSRERQTQSG